MGWYGERVVVCQKCHARYVGQPVGPLGSAPKAEGRGVGPARRKGEAQLGRIFKGVRKGGGSAGPSDVFDPKLLLLMM